MADQKTNRYLFTPNSEKPFQLSRYRIERFIDCPRCFWLDLRKGLKRPEPHPYTLNNAVDLLVKNEFDGYRKEQKPHPIMTRFGIDGVPFDHPKLADWQRTTTGMGMRYLYPGTNLDIMGSPDDIWLVRFDTRLMLTLVDTKATSSKITHPIEDDWWKSYRRQLDIYIWLLKRQETGHEVSDTGYFLLLNGSAREAEFNWMLKFEPLVVTYHADDSWVDGAIRDAYACLVSNRAPKSSENCEYCRYRASARKIEK